VTFFTTTVTLTYFWSRNVYSQMPFLMLTRSLPYPLFVHYWLLYVTHFNIGTLGASNAQPVMLSRLNCSTTRTRL